MDRPVDDTAMETYALPCADDLAPFLRRHMVGEGKTEHSKSLTIPPTGGMFLSYVAASPLTVHFSDRVYSERPRFFVGGQLRREQPTLVSDGKFELIGTEFSPSAFYQLFHHDVSSFTDSIHDFSEIFPDHAASLSARLNDRSSIGTKVQGIEDFLRTLVGDALATPRIDSAIETMLARRGIITVGEIAANAGLTTRQLHREFVKIVGVSPKHFAKIVQINAVFDALLSGDYEHIRALALDHGYFDQAHFIRDFQHVVGTSPMHFVDSGSAFLRTYLGKASP